MKYRELKQFINHTLATSSLFSETVIRACETLSRKISSGAYREIISDAMLYGRFTIAHLEEAAHLFSADYLNLKMERELGSNRLNPFRHPLGVLLHIGAGNMEGLPVYSVIEGLLTGNINILKLPASDDGISSFLLKEMIRIEPALKPYIYVFRLSSEKEIAIKRVAALADAIVVWGGDDAILSVRKMARPNTKIIEWGHKMSFAYVTVSGFERAIRMGQKHGLEFSMGSQLAGLAEHMAETGKRLCSSCQEIFLDTEDEEYVQRFCSDFRPMLEQAMLKKSEKEFGDEIGAAARNTLYRYNMKLSQAAGGRKEWAVLDYSVKMLPRREIIGRLRERGSYMQTVGLVCGEEEWEELSFLFIRAGAVRIRAGENMSKIEDGEPHDGEYPLMRYSRFVSETAAERK